MKLNLTYHKHIYGSHSFLWTKKKFHKDSYRTADGEDYQPPHHQLLHLMFANKTCCVEGIALEVIGAFECKLPTHEK